MGTGAAPPGLCSPLPSLPSAHPVQGRRGIRWAAGTHALPPISLGTGAGRVAEVRAGSTSREAHGGLWAWGPCKPPVSSGCAHYCPSAPVLKVGAGSFQLQPLCWKACKGAAHHEALTLLCFIAFAF